MLSRKYVSEVKPPVEEVKAFSPKNARHREEIEIRVDLKLQATLGMPSALGNYEHIKDTYEAQ